MRACFSRMMPHSAQNMAGSLLLAHPNLKDPHFRQSVVLLAAHEKEQGSVGIILNRPTNKTLAQLHSEFSYSRLAQVQVYCGGPVDPDQLIMTAWQWSMGLGMFKLHFGISPEQAEALLASDENTQVRCFKGLAAWEAGQLEEELYQMAWLPLPLSQDIINQQDKSKNLWKDIMDRLNPALLLNLLTPRDPSLN